jgi:hypothetical protein
MKTQTLRIFTLGLTLAFAAALFILKQNAVQALAPPPSTVAAADIERWRVTNGFYLYASGTSISALPVAANNYDPNSPWPVRYHDNQRTSNRTAPILNPTRQSLPHCVEI